MRIIVIGGTGYLGRAVARAARSQGHDVADVGHAELDLRAPLPALAADAIVNAAYVQRGPDLRAVTVDGAVALAVECKRRNIRFVQLSSDLVFAGREEPYTADDTPDPLDAYGRAKAEMEIGVLAQCAGALVVRTSLLWGASKPGPQEQLVMRACGGEPITFFTNEVRCPIEVDVLARRLVAVLDEDDRGVVHVAGPEALDRLTFARRIADRLGLDGRTLVGGTPSENAPPRPGRVVLSNTSRPWGTG